MMKVAKRVGKIAVAIVVAGLVVFVVIRKPSQGPTRHTISHGSSLTSLNPERSLWARVTFVREIWVAPDGSGRIAEHDDAPSFQTDADQARWVALGRPAPPSISGSFAPGKLAYVDLSGITRVPQSLFEKLGGKAAYPPEILRNVTLLMYETVPPRDLVDAIVAALRSDPRISVRDNGQLITFEGSDNSTGSATRSTIVINLLTGQLVSETRIALTPLPGLSANPPVLLVERILDHAELIYP